jgi:hypothetical protein
MAEAYFEFVDYEQRAFVIKLTSDQRIAEARRILKGEEKESVHVMGRLKKSKASWNPNWDFHMDPDTVSFFTMAIEVCDSTIQYVEDHLDEACGAFLPGCFWCPWSSKLTRELVNVKV